MYCRVLLHARTCQDSKMCIGFCIMCHTGAACGVLRAHEQKLQALAQALPLHVRITRRYMDYAAAPLLHMVAMPCARSGAQTLSHNP